MGNFFSSGSSSTEATEPGSEATEPGSESKATEAPATEAPATEATKKKSLSDRFKSFVSEKYNSAKSITTNIWDKSPEQIEKMIEKGNTEMGFPNERIFLALYMLSKKNNTLPEFKNKLFEYSKQGNTVIDESVENAIKTANQKEYEKISDDSLAKKFIETKKENFIKDIKKHDPNKISGGSRKTRRSKTSKKPKKDKKKRTPKKK